MYLTKEAHKEIYPDEEWEVIPHRKNLRIDRSVLSSRANLLLDEIERCIKLKPWGTYRDMVSVDESNYVRIDIVKVMKLWGASYPSDPKQRSKARNEIRAIIKELTQASILRFEVNGCGYDTFLINPNYIKPRKGTIRNTVYRWNNPGRLLEKPTGLYKFYDYPLASIEPNTLT